MKTKQTDSNSSSNAAMGLAKRERFDSTMGAQTGNDKNGKGNQKPSGNPIIKNNVAKK